MIQENRIIDIKVEREVTDFDLTDWKEHLSVTFTDDDDKIQRLVKAAYLAIEKYTNMSLQDKTITLTVDLYEPDFELPYGPVASITSVSFRTGTAANGTAEYEVLTAADDYTTDGEWFKKITSTRCGRHLIEYTCSLPTDDTFSDLVQAIEQEVSYRYEHTGDESQQYANEKVGVCEAAKALATPYIVMAWT